MSEDEKPKRKTLTASDAVKAALAKKNEEAEQADAAPEASGGYVSEDEGESPTNQVTDARLPAVEHYSPEEYAHMIIKKRIGLRKSIPSDRWMGDYFRAFDKWEKDVAVGSLQFLDTAENGAAKMNLRIKDKETLEDLESQLEKARQLEFADGGSFYDFEPEGDVDQALDALEDGSRDEPVDVPIEIQTGTQFTKTLVALEDTEREAFIKDFAAACHAEIEEDTLTNLLLVAKALEETREEFGLIRDVQETIDNDPSLQGMHDEAWKKRGDMRLEVERNNPDVFYRLPGEHELNVTSQIAQARGAETGRN